MDRARSEMNADRLIDTSPGSASGLEPGKIID
jgi:hypothetical protein